MTIGGTKWSSHPLQTTPNDSMIILVRNGALWERIIKADITKDQPISNINNLQNELDTKISDLTGQPISNITNLQTTLDSKVSDLTNQPISNITNLQTELDAKISDLTNQPISNTTNLQTTLDGKYPSLDLLSLVSDDSILVPVNIKESRFNAFNTDIDGANNNTVTYLASNTQTRMRQEGTVEKIECFAGASSDFSNVTSIKVQIWRRGSGGLYDLIGESEDIQSIFAGAVEGQLLTKTLSNPILDVKVNDYLGIQITSTGLAQDLFKSIGTAPLGFSITGAIGLTDIDFESATVLMLEPVIRCHMKSPWAVYIGSSYGLAAGNGFYANSNSVMDPTRHIPYIIQEKIGRSFQNNSIGGGNFAASLIGETTSRIKQMNPKVAFLELGTNDISAPTPTATFKADYATVLDDLISDGIKCVCIGVAPRTSTPENTQTRQDYNAAIRELVSERRSDAIFVDMDNGFGQRRPGVTKFNRSDILSSIDLDGVHYTDAGWSLMAKRIVEALFGDYN